MAPRDRLPHFTEEPAAATGATLQDALRQVGTWMAALTMAAGLLTLGFLLGGR
jgi:hypothetical protein